MAGKPKTTLVLSESERKQLQVWAGRHSATQEALALPSRIVLECATGANNKVVASKLDVTPQVVSKWRSHFVHLRLDGMRNSKGLAPPQSIDDAGFDAVNTKSWEEYPNPAHWNTCSLSKAARAPQTAGIHSRQALESRPYPRKTLEFHAEAPFFEKAWDIVGLYIDPPIKAFAFCIDDKGQIDGLDSTRAPSRRSREAAVRHVDEFTHEGTTSLFAALDHAVEQLVDQLRWRQRTLEFLRFLRTVNASVPSDLDICVVMNHYGTRRIPTVRNWFARQHRFHLQFTTSSAIWLNQVDRRFAELSDHRFPWEVDRPGYELENSIHHYLTTYNVNPKPFSWAKCADAISASMQRFWL